MRRGGEGRANATTVGIQPYAAVVGEVVVLLVVALGGNALYGGSTPPNERARRLERTASQLADLVEDGHELVVTHGNGPQVGALLLDQEARADRDGGGLPLPLDVCVAMTQAEIGYRIQRAVGRELAMRGMPREVVAIVTQVAVDVRDPAFARPSKPIGPYWDERPVGGGQYLHTEDGRWRRVVASPAPAELVETGAITAMLAAGILPICAGGGGVPVVRDGHRLTGIEAVIDKDATSALLASDLDAEGLLVLTDVPRVVLDRGTPQARSLDELTTGDVEELVRTGQATTGSMAPKLRALARAASEGRWAALGPLERAVATTRGEVGTRVVRGGPTGLLAGRPAP